MGPIARGRPGHGHVPTQQDAEDLPIELVDALSLYPIARDLFARLSQNSQRQYVEYVAHGDAHVARRRRAWQALALLAAHAPGP